MHVVPENVHVLPEKDATNGEEGGAANVAVLTGFNTNVEHVNPMYQTMHDDASTINADDLVQVATTIARALYALATVDNVKDAVAMKRAVSQATHLSADRNLIAKLMNCSVVSWHCPLTQEYIPWMIDIADGKQKGEEGCGCWWQRFHC